LRANPNVPDFTRPATWDDLKTIARYLAEAGVDYALIGGYAIALHGFNRVSEDIDLLVDPSGANARRCIAALARLPDGAARELESERDVFANDRRYAIRINDEITVDVLPSAGGHTWDELKAHIVRVDVDGVSVAVLDLEGLLLTKQGVRPKDQMDAAVLRQAISGRRDQRGEGSGSDGG
jgi:predicted nucleotidyltransferase